MKKLVLIAIVFSLIAGFAAYRFSMELQKSDAPATIKVVAANGRITPFVPITSEMIKTMDIPAQSVHPLSVKDSGEILGMVALSPLEDGEVILSTKVTEQEKSGASLSYKLQNGYRAMTFLVDEVSGVAGYITVGDSVDVLAMREKTEEDGSITTLTYFVAQNVEVIKAGVKGTPAESGYSSLTLSVPSEDALRYYYMLSQSEYRFTLRAVSDDEIIEPSEYTLPD
ncbi:MAG: Flp pilus assembly protein CpaB [Eubacteriales bacterium]